MDIYHWALQPQRTGILKLVWAPHAEWANEDLIQRLLESILAFDLSLFYPCWWLMSVVKTPGRRLLWFAVVAVETLMSRVVLIFEITFKIHYLPSVERSWKSSTWRSNQTSPVAPFSLSWLDFSFLKLATLRPTALVTPSTIPEELCTGFGDTQPPASLRFRAGRPTSHIFLVVFHRNISKSIPSWQGAIILIALPRRQSKAKICPRKCSLVSHTQNPIPSSWPSTYITLHKHEDLKSPFLKSSLNPSQFCLYSDRTARPLIKAQDETGSLSLCFGLQPWARVGSGFFSGTCFNWAIKTLTPAPTTSTPVCWMGAFCVIYLLLNRSHAHVNCSPTWAGY